VWHKGRAELRRELVWGVQERGGDL
jgi:hypothetical protein